MVKLITFIIGLALFSIITSLLFGAVDDYTTENKVRENDQDWAALSGNYNQQIRDLQKEDSNLRNIDDQSNLGAGSSENTDVTLLTGVLSAGRLVTNFYTNFENITNIITSDVNKDGTTLIDPKIRGAIVAIIGIILILIVVHFIRGFKTET